tara:strand:+ start:177 stop:566 length:390 start_codon:yes stop_codon:yes gene_type:complete
MSKRGDTTSREELRKEMIINLEGLLDEPGLTSSESKMIKGKIKELKAGGNPYNTGGDVKNKNKKVPVISISVGMVEMKKDPSKKAKMMNGGMANGKAHMYAAGGSVKMNPGLKALKTASPETFNKITKS